MPSFSVDDVPVGDHTERRSQPYDHVVVGTEENRRFDEARDIIGVETLDDNMDTSWADQEEEMIEKEPMSDIMCWLLYIDTEGNLQHVHKEKQSLDDMGMDDDVRKWSRNRLIQFIHTKKQYQGLKYRLMEILLYHMGLETNQLMNLSLQPAVIQNVTLQDEIKIPPSLCIFHDINCLYFLFQEVPKYDDDVPEIKTPLSIGDTCTLPRNNRHKKTKKVTFKDPPDFRHTKKNT